MGDGLNILFLTLVSMENINEPGIYSDLAREMASNGMNVYVVCPREKRMGLLTELEIIDNINVLRIKTGNITKTNFIEKGFATLNIERQYLRAINNYFKNIRFDMLIYSTPPITFEKVVAYFKKNQHSFTYLMLKDIFPQNAIDIGILKFGSLLHRYFRRKEKEIYAISDYIGCMSPANIDYVIRHNPEVDKNRVELFPNTIKVRSQRPKSNDFKIRRSLGISDEKIVFVFGGNLGIPQGVGFLIDCLEKLQTYENAYFLIVGDGTERAKIETRINDLKLQNVKLLNHIPKDDYDKLIYECDVGLVLLDKRFTIPNYPSRILTYMDMALPVLAATDNVSDIKDLLKEAECGLWAYSGDHSGFIEQVHFLCENSETRIQMGKNGRRCLEDNFDVSKSATIIKRHFEES